MNEDKKIYFITHGNKIKEIEKNEDKAVNKFDDLYTKNYDSDLSMRMFTVSYDEEKKIKLVNNDNFDSFIKKEIRKDENSKEFLDFKNSFEDKYRYPEKLDNKIDNNPISEIIADYETFKKHLDDYIKTEDQNDDIRFSNIQKLQGFLNDSPEKFNNYSEMYFDSGTKQNTLPQVVIKNPKIKTGNQFKKALTNKLVKSTESLAKSKLSFAKKSATQLKNFRTDQFKTYLSEVRKEKSIKQESQSKKKTNKESLKMA
ncbi:hypothetical protein QJU11_09965 [Pasteurella atlantica]|uniref:hypothetical protein n=1 Tax=Phocoenobacter atlanticus TaxID=3416742 RepID=UPI00277250F6|nr:hypothetical protein [Pasteurella atlantica]MDP8042516.1 hypothetical protein [Pasteurella atlantica]